ncbi:MULTISPECIES: transcriptional regulator [Enterobacterales]|uniref:transcriptional regulator n=1 Tax=Enterobacterales TaxID=91347 RepID=UPI0013DB7408|nr:MULTISPECIES: transcriptional regulator [Enterobacterales]MDE4684522.1 hypothetical protein [Klebsiella pneumoniae]
MNDETNPVNIQKDRPHDEMMAELFRSDPAHAIAILAEVRRCGDADELHILIRQLRTAFGPDWPGFIND